MDNFRKEMDPYTSFCSKSGRIIFCSGVLFGIYKLEIYFVVIYFGICCVVPETLKPSFTSHARPAHIIKCRNIIKNLVLVPGGFIF